MAAWFVFMIGVIAQESPPIIAPAEAFAHVGQEVTIKMTVASAHLLPAQGLCLLNSEVKHRDPQTFTVVLTAASLQELAALEVADPVQFFRGKKIAVSGRVRLFRGKPQIEAATLEQLRVILPVSPVSPEDSAVPADPSHPGTSQPGKSPPGGDAPQQRP